MYVYIIYLLLGNIYVYIIYAYIPPFQKHVFVCLLIYQNGFSTTVAHNLLNCLDPVSLPLARE